MRCCGWFFLCSVHCFLCLGCLALHYLLPRVSSSVIPEGLPCSSPTLRTPRHVGGANPPALGPTKPLVCLLQTVHYILPVHWEPE